MNTFNSYPEQNGEKEKQADIQKRNRAEVFFNKLEKAGLSSQQLFARILQDPKAFEYAILTKKLHELIPELQTLEESVEGKDPNIYRPMPVMQHMLEAMRQTFGWVRSFGLEEYRGDLTKQNALLWINTSLLFHDQGEIAIIKGTNLPLWYRFSVDWSKKRRRNILRETYPFFGMDTPEGRSYINHLRHPEISAALAADSLLRLGWDPKGIRVVQFLIRNHSVLIEKATYGRLKDGRALHKDLYEEIASVSENTGVPEADLLKMLQVVQIMDAQAVKSGMAQIPQETMMRVWMAFSYMTLVLKANSSARRQTTFNNYRKAFSQIRKEMPFGTPFSEAFEELLGRIEKGNGRLDEADRKLLEEELEYFDRFEIIREDHIHINNQFNHLLHLIERTAGKELSSKEKAVLLQAYKIAYRSHDGQFRRAHKVVPTGDKRRKFIEHPIKVASIMVKSFGITDPLILATVLFHDVLEDTDIDVNDILAAFKNEDLKGRIIRALSLLTKPESRSALKEKLYKDLAYFIYVAKLLTAGDKCLNDWEMFEWLRYVLPRIKAADKIHNRRSLIGRKPEGRIKEICRNGNTLVILMESSNLTIEEKLKVLKEFDRSFFNIFGLCDIRDEANANRFHAALSEFRQFFGEQVSRAGALSPEKAKEIEEFENSIETLSQCLKFPDTVVERLQDVEKGLPVFCRKIGMNDGQISQVVDAFAFFLFNISEVHWITDEGKRRIIQFQAIIRLYKSRINGKSWEPELAPVIDNLARYVQGYSDASPAIRILGLPDLFDLFSRVPFLHHWYDRFLTARKRKLVARLLPRVAMLPIRNIYWLDGSKIKSVHRDMVEREIGGLTVVNTCRRIVLKVNPLLALFG
ncbi:MAG: hypothetical protein P8Z37_10025 [Acidobacteriota bacterium]